MLIWFPIDSFVLIGIDSQVLQSPKRESNSNLPFAWDFRFFFFNDGIMQITNLWTRLLVFCRGCEMWTSCSRWPSMRSGESLIIWGAETFFHFTLCPVCGKQGEDMMIWIWEYMKIHEHVTYMKMFGSCYSAQSQIQRCHVSSLSFRNPRKTLIKILRDSPTSIKQYPLVI